MVEHVSMTTITFLNMQPVNVFRLPILAVLKVYNAVHLQGGVTGIYQIKTLKRPVFLALALYQGESPSGTLQKTTLCLL